MKTFHSFSVILLLSAAIINGQNNDDGLNHLRAAIPGEPGRDYPIYSFADLRRRNNGNRRNNNNNNRNQLTQQQQQQQLEEQERRSQVNPNIPEEFQDQIDNGQIPGRPGQDYPVNSVSSLRGKFNNLQLAPKELITPDFPGLRGNNNNSPRETSRRRQQPQGQRRNNNIQQQRQRPPQQRQQQQQPSQRPQQQQRPQRTQKQQPRPQPQQQQRPQRRQQPRPQQQRPRAPLPVIDHQGNVEEGPSFEGQYCPGGALDTCIDFCPRDTFSECVEECGKSCA